MWRRPRGPRWAKVHRHRANLRNWPVTPAESTSTAPFVPSALDGGDRTARAASAGTTTWYWPVRCGSGQAMEGGATNLVGPASGTLQALARLHARRHRSHGGRGRGSRAGRAVRKVAARLDLVTLVTGASTAPAPVLAAVAHGVRYCAGPFAVPVLWHGVSLAAGHHGLRSGSARPGVLEVFWLRRRGTGRRPPVSPPAKARLWQSAITVDVLSRTGRRCAGGVRSPRPRRDASAEARLEAVDTAARAAWRRPKRVLARGAR